MDIRPVTADSQAVSRYERLFNRCFPHAVHLDAPYLKWLYCDNPTGSVIGFDAWDGDRLAAHYACIPAMARLNGVRSKVMLSLNTATDPDYQGRGLFTKLAEATYAAAAHDGVKAVYGVANANSTPGFIRKLGFSLIKPLDAVIGRGSVLGTHVADAQARAGFYREWSPDTLKWRLSNPARPYRLVRTNSGVLGVEALSGKPTIRAWAEVSTDSAGGLCVLRPSLTARLHLGATPAGIPRPSGLWVKVPEVLRSSPLNLIFRPLVDQIDIPDSSQVLFGQLDFDAY